MSRHLLLPPGACERQSLQGTVWTLLCQDPRKTNGFLYGLAASGPWWLAWAWAVGSHLGEHSGVKAQCLETAWRKSSFSLGQAGC